MKKYWLLRINEINESILWLTMPLGTVTGIGIIAIIVWKGIEWLTDGRRNVKK